MLNKNRTASFIGVLTLIFLFGAFSIIKSAFAGSEGCNHRAAILVHVQEINTTPQQVPLAHLTDRGALLIQNDSANNVYISQNPAVSGANGFLIAPGDTLELQTDGGTIFASATGPATVRTLQHTSTCGPSAEAEAEARLVEEAESE
jgi:hypothetical protein